MKYYLHDSTSFNDEKITMLFIKFGYEGLGLFYTILEKLALQEKPMDTDVLKHQLKVGKRLNKIWSFMEEIDIISSNNGETFNKQLLNFSGKYQIKKEKTAKRVSEWRKNQLDTESVTRYEHVRNTPKVNKSKVKESKEEKESIDFDVFWNLYAKKKGDREACKKKWNNLNIDIQEEIIKTIPKYIASISEKQFQPYPAKFLNQKLWQNEIEINNHPNNPTDLNKMVF